MAAPTKSSLRTTTKRLTSSYSLLKPLFTYTPTPTASQQAADTFFLSEKILIHLKQGNLISFKDYLFQLTPSPFLDIVYQCSRNNPQICSYFINTITTHHPKFKHSSVTLSASVHILVRTRKLSEAQALLLKLIRKSGISRTEIVDSLISTYHKCGSSPLIFDLLIRTYVQARKLREGVEAFRLVKSRGLFVVPINGCNSLLGGLVKIGWVDLVWEVYNEVVSSGVQVNVFTMNIMVNAICKEGKFDKVNAFLVEYEVKDVLPDMVTYNTLINGYSRVGRVDEAFEVMNAMREKGLEPGLYTYNAILNGVCRNGSFERAKEIVNEMMLNGLSPDQGRTCVDLRVRTCIPLDFFQQCKKNYFLKVSDKNV